MRAALLCLLALAPAVAAPVPKAVKKQDDVALLEGRWESVTLDHGNGHQPDTSFWLEIKDGKLSTGIGTTKGFVERPFALDPTRSPKHIDITDTSGRVLPWVYEIDGDTLTWCYTADQSVRATELKGGGKDRNTCTVWKRVRGN